MTLPPRWLRCCTWHRVAEAHEVQRGRLQQDDRAQRRRRRRRRRAAITQTAHGRPKSWAKFGALIDQGKCWANSRDLAQPCATRLRSTVAFARRTPWTCPAGPEHRRFWPLSALRAHKKPPYKTDLLWETERALNRPPGAGPDLGLKHARAGPDKRGHS